MRALRGRRPPRRSAR